MIDISELSYSELIDLGKAVEKAKKCIELKKSKSSLGTEQLHERFANSFNKSKPETIKDEYLYTLKNFSHDAIINLCDLVLGNFSLKESVPRGFHMVQDIDNDRYYKIVRNGYAIRVDLDTYNKMYTDLVELCIKYSEYAEQIKLDK